MSNTQKITLSQSKTTVSQKYAVMMIFMTILEIALAVALARIWLSWQQIPYVATGVLGLGLLLTDMLFLSPARNPDYIYQDNLILRYGYQLKVTIPRNEIISIEDTNMQSSSLMVPFGIAKEAKTGVMFLTTGPSNRILITLKHPVRVKSLFWNHGYIDKFVVNYDNPDMVKEMVVVNLPNEIDMVDSYTNPEATLLNFSAVVSSANDKEGSILSITHLCKNYSEIDPNGIVQVKELLRSIAAKGKTVVISTHILEMAEKLCDRVGIIINGKMIFVGTVTELKQRMEMDMASLEDIFIKLAAGKKSREVN